MKRNNLRTADYVEGILAGDRVLLARAITLVESRRADHGEQALEILECVMPHTGASKRIGVTGVPGAGKSTFIEALGSRLTEEGHKIAVLAVDPSSTISKGSILGDKTRMERLGTNERAFIRPSPSSGTLGGVARKTRETILLCEAAGYDVIFVETVGVGQSETLVHSMVDFFLLILIAGAGDELQGIKRGIVELADTVVINKADGDNVQRAKQAKADYRNALALLRPASSAWAPPVLLCSALEETGIAEVWKTAEQYFSAMKTAGELDAKRRLQAEAWLMETIAESLQERFYEHPGVRAHLQKTKTTVLHGEMSPLAGAKKLLDAFQEKRSDSKQSIG